MRESLVNSDQLEGESCYICRHPFNFRKMSSTSSSTKCNCKWTIIYDTNKRHGGKCFLKTTITGIHSASNNRN